MPKSSWNSASRLRSAALPGSSASALVSSNVSDRSSSPWRAAMRWPTKPPMDRPTQCTGAMPS